MTEKQFTVALILLNRAFSSVSLKSDGVLQPTRKGTLRNPLSSAGFFLGGCVEGNETEWEIFFKKLKTQNHNYGLVV